MSTKTAHGQFLEAVNIIPETNLFSVRQLQEPGTGVGSAKLVYKHVLSRHTEL
jgi:hypothetical protein